MLSSFYHDGEVVVAKNLLCQAADSVESPIKGWAKLVNSKGAPINHKGDSATKRDLDTDDIMSMLAVLEVNGVQLPTYVVVNMSRLPPR